MPDTSVTVTVCFSVGFAVVGASVFGASVGFAVSAEVEAAVSFLELLFMINIAAIAANIPTIRTEMITIAAIRPAFFFLR